MVKALTRTPAPIVQSSRSAADVVPTQQGTPSPASERHGAWQPSPMKTLKHAAEKVADEVVNTVLVLDHGHPTKLGGLLETQDWLKTHYEAFFHASPKNADGSYVADRAPWPSAAFGPGVKGTHVFVHNEKVVTQSPAKVMQVIRNAGSWSKMCDNLTDARIEGGGQQLQLGSKFRWTTFGSNLNGEIVELNDRSTPMVISWRAKDRNLDGKEIDVCHRYLLYPTSDGGTRIVTEESQRGFLTAPVPVLNPNQEKMMLAGHQYLLDCIAKAAAK